MGKKMFIYGFFFFAVLSFVLSFCHRANAAEYTVYTDATIDSQVLDSYVQVEQSALSVDSESPDGESAVAPATYAVTNTIYTVYDSGLPSSSYLDWATGLVKNVPFNQDYVFFRSGQYQYIFATGDYSNGFTAPSTVYVLQLSNNYNGSYSFYSVFDNGFSLTPGQGVVYSSVDEYPSLLGADYSRTILFAFILFCWSLLALYLAKFAFESLHYRR